MENRKRITRIIIALLLAASLMLTSSCGAADNSSNTANNSNTEPQTDPQPDPGTDPVPAEKNGDIMILFTSDVHCAIDQGFGYAGLQQIRDAYEAKGYTTILVDDGDSIQGEAIGTLTRGEAVMDLMNKMGYDVAVPGNHEFDYTVERFLELAEKAEFTYVSCNFNKQGEMLFAPYKIVEAAGKKIAFVGVITPHTPTSSTPKYFQDENGEFIYDFLQDETGELLYGAVQKAIDDARAEGADYVYVLGHMGMGPSTDIYTYADVIEHTSGIDVFLDGHSHDTEQVVMKDKDGNTVVRSACGTKFSCIGYSHISAENGIVETNILTWNNSTPMPDLLGLDNDMAKAVNAAKADLQETLNRVVAAADVELSLYEPDLKDENGKPIRRVRRAETPIGDLCADAFRVQSGSDIGMIIGGGIRAGIAKGDITYANIISVFPFGNSMCVRRVTGQQVLNALEWGVCRLPAEFPGFLSVSGITFDVDVSAKSVVTFDDNGMMTGISGERRVKNVMVGGEALDPAKYYTVASIDYTILNNGDGFTAFEGSEVLVDGGTLDNQMLIDYITEALGGRIGAGYEDPYGAGRINIIDAQ